MADINEVFGEYDPNRPIVSVDKDKMRALLQALADLPTKLPKGVAEGLYNTFNFYKNQIPFINAESTEDAVKEAILLAMPGHTRTKQGRLEVDKKRTAEVNKKFNELAKKDPNSLIRLYKDNKPMSFDSYNTLRQMKSYPDNYGLKSELSDLFDVWDDIIVSDKTSGKPLYSKVTNPFPTHTYSRGTWADDKPKLPHQDPEYIATRYEPERLHVAYDDRDVKNYNFTTSELDSYDKPSLRDLYRRDYPNSPYNSWEQYDYSLRNKGISGETYNKLMELGREYEQTILNETMPYQDKLRKLTELKNEMEVLETLENLE